MKKAVLIIAISVFSINAFAQTWTSVNLPSNMVWQAAELNSKLYIATGGNGIQEYDGATWTNLTDFNNSYNTPHKSKSSIVNINGLLYAGAGDFNTSGEGTIHTYNGTTFSLLQNSDFQYNGSYKIADFAEYNGVVYAGGQFMSPDNASANLAKWNGTDWVGVSTNSLNVNGNQNNVVSRLIVFQNKLYVISQSKVLYYDGTAWDSLASTYSSYTDAVVHDGELYLCGIIVTYDGNGNPTGSGTIGKWNGTTLSIVDNLTTGLFDGVRRLFSDGTNLYATAKVKAQNNDVYLVKYNGTTWSNFAFLQEASGGYVQGYPLPDYNYIFKFNNELYIGGRFTEINNQPIQSLAKIGLPTPAIPAAPSNLTVTPVNSMDLNWHDNSNNEDGFYIESTQDTVAGSWTQIASVASDVTYYHHTGLNPGEDYFYRVRAYNANGNSAYSNISGATEHETGITHFDNVFNAVNVYPNPANNFVNLANIPNGSAVKIIDITGKVVYSSAITNEQTTTINTADFTNGIYLIRIDTNGSSANRKLIVNK